MKATLIIADGLRPADIGPYGNEWLPTPNLDRLAAESIVFDQHFTDRPSSITFRARFELSATQQLSAIGLPSEVRVTEYRDLLPPWNPPDSCLESAFEDWEFEDEPAPWLDPQPGWFDANDAAGPKRLRRTHAAAVLQFDEWLGAILDRNPDGALIVTSWRGQNLGEHGMVGDFRPWLFEEMVHVPLIVRLPQREQSGRRVAHLTQPVDIVATLFDVCRDEHPADWHGHSLLPLCRGGGPIRSYAVMAHWQPGAAELALQTPDVKIILPTEVPHDDPPRRAMLFVKPDDRWDVNDLRQQNLDDAEHMERTLMDFVAASQRPGPLMAPPLPEEETGHADREARR
jgi:arylsulfatase A-like enzyme